MSNVFCHLHHLWLQISSFAHQNSCRKKSSKDFEQRHLHHLSSTIFAESVLQIEDVQWKGLSNVFEQAEFSQGYVNPGNACAALVLHKIQKEFQIRKLNKWDENTDQIFCNEHVILNPEQSNQNLTLEVRFSSLVGL